MEKISAVIPLTVAPVNCDLDMMTFTKTPESRETVHIWSPFSRKVPSSEEEVHLRAEGAETEGAEPLRHPVYHQPHHGTQVLPHQNVPGGRLRSLLPVHAGRLS